MLRVRSVPIVCAGLLCCAGLEGCWGDTVSLGRSPASGGSVALDSSGGSGGTSGADGIGQGAAGAGGIGQGAAGAGGIGQGAADATGGAGGAPTAVKTPEFGTPTAVARVNGAAKDDNPTLTDDMLELYFSSTRTGEGGASGDPSGDIWYASRASLAEDFSEPVRVEALCTDGFDASPAVAGDGLTLWVATVLDSGLGGLDIYASNRRARGEPWSGPTWVGELCSSADDIPRPTGNQGLSMPLGSRRDSANTDYSTYLADRDSIDAPFGVPRRLDELELEGFTTVDAFLSRDGLTLYYVHAADDMGDLFVATRPDLGSGFGSERPLTSINTDSDERDPWLSPDGSLLYFASDRDGDLDIYVAERIE